MEGEGCYSTVIFKAFDNDTSKAQQLPGKESGLPPQDHQSEDSGLTHPQTQPLTVFSQKAATTPRKAGMLNRWICKMTSLTWPQFHNISTRINHYSRKREFM
ncbi:hypothetical protein IRJ41_006363 [Triplophysa rosa]|uniref:Uncharacterized protein n=1 Tax=Triplophysa rosa TaxID=992332 RepID=A0A9W8C3X4_TRIRA|nr:hypothetical protein IRJ41_006363 [Triplophysa rosa]